MPRTTTGGRWSPRRRTEEPEVTNPWLPQNEAPTGATEPTRVAPASRLHGPQTGVKMTAGTTLPVREHFASPGLWVLGTHGGSGESSIADLHQQWAPAGHAWPAQPYSTRALPVLLVCRSNAAGLLSAQAAATQWAAGQTPPVELVGLVVVADAPGRVPKALRDLAHVVSGGVPRVWDLPWIEQWRLGTPPTTPPAGTRRLLDDLDLILNPGTPGANLGKATP